MPQSLFCVIYSYAEVRRPTTKVISNIVFQEQYTDMPCIVASKNKPDIFALVSYLLLCISYLIRTSIAVGHVWLLLVFVEKLIILRRRLVIAPDMFITRHTTILQLLSVFVGNGFVRKRTTPERWIHYGTDLNIISAWHTWIVPPKLRRITFKETWWVITYSCAWLQRFASGLTMGGLS